MLENRKWNDYLLFATVISILFFVFIYPKVLPQHPKAVHQWRQCDGGSITMMYVHNRLNPFQPEVHNRHGQGKTVAEFPIIYYLNASIITIVGVQYKNFVIRSVNLLIFYIGLFYLFKLGILLLKNKWLAIIPVIFLHACPIVAYYAASSVPDVPALALTIVGVFYLFQYLMLKKEKYFWFGILFFALSGMIKSTILISYLSICSVLWMAYLVKSNQFRMTIAKLLFLGLPLLATFVWVLTAKYYNEIHENITFLLSVKPIWDLDRAFIDKTSIRIKTFWLSEYSYTPMMWLIFSGGLLFLFNKNKRANLIKTGIIVLIFGSTLYFYLFFEQFYEHDYYAIELLPILLSLLMGGLYWIDNQKISSKIKMGGVSLIVVLLILNVWSTRKNMLRRYNEDGKWNAYYDAYVELKPQLRAYGIEYSDKVLISSDASPNISLYLLDQLGWTRFPYGLDETMVEAYIKEGAKYVITREEDQVNRPFLLPYLKEEILRHKNLVVYRL